MLSQSNANLASQYPIEKKTEKGFCYKLTISDFEERKEEMKESPVQMGKELELSDKLILYFDKEGKKHIREKETKKEISALSTETGHEPRFTLTSEGQLVSTGYFHTSKHDDYARGIVKVWDVKTGEALHEWDFSTYYTPTEVVAIPQNRVCIFSTFGIFCIDVASRQEMKRYIEPHMNYISTMLMVPNTHFMVVGFASANHTQPPEFLIFDTSQTEPECLDIIRLDSFKEISQIELTTDFKLSFIQNKKKIELEHELIKPLSERLRAHHSIMGQSTPLYPVLMDLVTQYVPTLFKEKKPHEETVDNKFQRPGLV